MITWSQESNKVYCSYKGLDVYFYVPLDFSIENTRPETLELLTILLFSPFHKDMVSREFVAKDVISNKCGLSLSTGKDSVAAMMLLPKGTELCYMRRDFESLLKHDNADRFCEAIPQKVWSVRSNHEKIRTFHNLSAGFSTDLSCVAHLVLMSDYLGIGRICLGSPTIEQTYLRENHYKHFCDKEFVIGVDPYEYNLWSLIFSHFGFELVMPTFGLSEIITSNIVSNSIYNNRAHSCLRTNGRCGDCYKCYKDSLIRGKPIKMGDEAKRAVSKKIESGRTIIYPSLFYGMKKCNKVPSIANKKWGRLLKCDYSYIERYPEFYLKDVLPEDIAGVVKKNLDLLGVQKMTDKDLVSMYSFGSIKK